MAAAALPKNETQRLARLKRLAVLDSPPEPLFDHLTRLAAQICETPIALVSLVDEHRQWFKAEVGLGTQQTAREHAFCAHSLHRPQILEVRDALADPRFADNPLVLAAPHIRFYAGAPIVLDDGTQPGTLCVIDRQPRALTDAQKRLLAELADAVAEGLMMRERRLVELVERAVLVQHAIDERFRVLAEQSPLGVYLTDAQGACQYTNPAWQGIYGMSLEQSLGDGWMRTLHPEDAGEVGARWAEAAHQRKPFEMRFRTLRADGSVRYVLSRARGIEDAQGQITGYVGNVEDVTELRAAEQELAENRELLDRMGRIASIGAWSWDLRSHELRWSDQTCRIHGRPPGYQPSPTEAVAYFAPEGRLSIEAAVHQAMSTGDGWDMQLPLITAQGQSIWVRTQGEVDLEHGVPARLAGAFQDVTSQHNLIQELEGHREKLRSLYETTPALMHAVDADLQIVSVSDDWLTWLGYRREQVLGRPLADFLPPETARHMREVHRPLAAREGRFRDRPSRFVAADGSVRDVLVSAVTEYNSQCEPVRFMAFLTDVTEDLQRRAQLAEEQRLRQQVERHAADLDQLLRERSEMLDVLAHEVRQPLNNASAALQSASATLAAKGEDDALQRLSRAQSVLGQVLAGIDNTLAEAALLASSAHSARLDTDIDTLIGVCIADLPREQRERIRVERPTATRTALMDMSLMRLALRNLLSNALKYSPAGSPVCLRVLDSDEPLAVIFEVADAGPGFDPEVQARLFERGARTGKRAMGAHGLGLYIVRRVMEAHAGQAELVSTGPQGSVMRLTLPQHD